MTAYTFLMDGEVEAEKMTFVEVDEVARGIGVTLAGMGGTGERVLLLYPPGLEFVSAFLGCLYAGALAVPAYPPRSARGLPRLRSIVADARPRVVMTTASLLSSRADAGPARRDAGARGRSLAVHGRSGGARRRVARARRRWRNDRLPAAGRRELGGTSLTGIQLVAELKKQLGVEVPTVSIFQAPTVSALVRYLRPKEEASASAFDRSRSRAEKKKQVFARARHAAARRRA